MVVNTKFERSVFKVDPCLKSRLEQGKVRNVDGLSTVCAGANAHNEALEPANHVHPASLADNEIMQANSCFSVILSIYQSSEPDGHVTPTT